MLAVTQQRTPDEKWKGSPFLRHWNTINVRSKHGYYRKPYCRFNVTYIWLIILANVFLPLPPSLWSCLVWYGLVWSGHGSYHSTSSCKNAQEQKGKERRRPTAYSSSTTPAPTGAISSRTAAKTNSDTTVIRKVSPSSNNGKGRNTMKIKNASGGAGSAGTPSVGGSAPGKGAGAGDDVAAAAAERRRREVLIATKMHRTPAEVQTFTLDHFVQGVVEWDIFGEIHAEATGERYATKINRSKVFQKKN